MSWVADKVDNAFDSVGDAFSDAWHWVEEEVGEAIPREIKENPEIALLIAVVFAPQLIPYIGQSTASAVGLGTVNAATATAIGAGVASGTMTALKGGDVGDVLRSAVISGVSAGVGSAAGSYAGTEAAFAVDAYMPGLGVTAGNIAEKVVSGAVRNSLDVGLRTGDWTEGLKVGAIMGAASSLTDVFNLSDDFRDLPNFAKNVVAQSTIAAVTGKDPAEAATMALLQSAIQTGASVISKTLKLEKNSDIAKFAKENPEAATLLFGSVSSAITASLSGKNVNDAVMNNAVNFAAEKIRQGIKSGVLQNSLVRAQESYAEVDDLSSEITEKSKTLNSQIQNFNGSLPATQKLIDRQVQQQNKTGNELKSAYENYQKLSDSYQSGGGWTYDEWGNMVSTGASLEQVRAAADEVNALYSRYTRESNAVNNTVENRNDQLAQIEKTKAEIGQIQKQALEKVDQVTINSFLFTNYAKELENDLVSNAEYIADPNKYSLYQEKQNKIGLAYDEYLASLPKDSVSTKVAPNSITPGFQIDGSYNVIDRKTNEVVGKIPPEQRAIEAFKVNKDESTGKLSIDITTFNETPKDLGDEDGVLLVRASDLDGVQGVLPPVIVTATSDSADYLEELRAEDPMAWYYAVGSLPEKQRDRVVPWELGRFVESTWDSVKKAIPATIKNAITNVVISAKPETSTLEIISSLAGLGKNAAEAFGANNALAKKLEGAEMYVQAMISAAAKNDIAEANRIMDAAKDAGFLDQTIAAFEALKAYPAALMKGVGSVAGAALMLAPALALSTTAATARIATYGLGAMTGAGVGKGTIYDETKKALTEANEKHNLGLSSGQIELKAQEAQAYNGKNLDLIVLNTVAGAFAGGTGAEKIIAKGIASDIASNVAQKAVAKQFVEGGIDATKAGFKEGFWEYVQGAADKASGNIALQREGFDIPTMRGVGTAGAYEALIGAPMGSGLSIADSIGSAPPGGFPPSGGGSGIGPGGGPPSGGGTGIGPGTSPPSGGSGTLSPYFLSDAEKAALDAKVDQIVQVNSAYKAATQPFVDQSKNLVTQYEQAQQSGSASGAALNDISMEWSRAQRQIKQAETQASQQIQSIIEGTAPTAAPAPQVDPFAVEYDKLNFDQQSNAYIGLQRLGVTDPTKGEVAQ
jgi:hypothetical protein